MELLLATIFLGKPIWMWLVFVAVVLVLLVLDLGVLHKDQHEIGVKESLLLSSFYITIALAFGGWIWFEMGREPALEYLTGFVVEKSLAMDNIFVIAMIFSFFAVPRKYQHRVLFWGILGVIILRAIMIALGATLVSQFGWVLYIFALFLLLTGYKLLVLTEGAQAVLGSFRGARPVAAIAWALVSAALGFAAYVGMAENGEGVTVQTSVYLLTAASALLGGKIAFLTHQEETDLAGNPLLRWLRRHLRVTDSINGQDFTVRLPDPRSGKAVTYFTPLFLTLLMIEIADVIFAVDSVPAIFAITTDPYIVYTSNIFAILGLRALYFALAAMMARFAYLKYALSLVLIFIGSKVFISNLMGWEKFPASWSLAITVGLLAGGFAYSIWKTRGTEGHGG
ncbi:TerC family protein [Geomonas edaphica]|uniref:TerC family protein n=1 Tax=Geomonas edaphica TaxID=2570226 RepID=UPI0010A84718|nr:TerC family protein [Geomonas edaphica]